MARLQRPTAAPKLTDVSDEIPGVVERGRFLKAELGDDAVVVLKALANEGHGPGLCIIVAEDVFEMTHQDAKELVHSQLMGPNVRKTMERLNNDLAHVAAMANTTGEDGPTQ